jgi:hypothetical protein
VKTTLQRHTEFIGRFTSACCGSVLQKSTAWCLMKADRSSNKNATGRQAVGIVTSSEFPVVRQSGGLFTESEVGKQIDAGTALLYRAPEEDRWPIVQHIHRHGRRSRVTD